MKKAKSQKVQEITQEILYCETGWHEHEIYGQRFRKIIDRSSLDEGEIKVDEETAKEYRRRVIRKLNGKEPLDKNLLFYGILATLCGGGRSEAALVSLFDDHKPGNLRRNLYYLERCGLIEKEGEEYRILPKFKKVILNLK